MIDPKTDGMEFAGLATASLEACTVPKACDLIALVRPCSTRPRRSIAGRIIGLPVLGLSLLVTMSGCYESSPSPLVLIESDLRIGLPVGGSDTGDLHVQTISAANDQFTTTRPASANLTPVRSTQVAFRSPMSVSGANARLAKLDEAGPSRDRMKWGLNQLQSHLHPPITTLTPGATTFVQVTQPVPQVPVVQTPQPIEVVEAPQPDPQPPKPQQPMEIAPGSPPRTGPEVIPTPEGVPENAPKGTPNKPMAENPSDGKDVGQPVLPTESSNSPSEPMAINAPSTSTPRNESIGGLKRITDDGAAAIPAEFAAEDYSTWAAPDVTLFVTGQQNGYIEPCGCTGLEKQKGGVARRYTFIKQLKAQGWDLFLVDAGNQVRRVGRQASMKLSWSTEALKKMGYESVGFGPDDLRLPATDLLQLAASDNPSDAMYISGNVVLYDASYIPAFKVVKRGVHQIGITNILDPESLGVGVRTEADINPVIDSAKKALDGMNEQNATFKVLTFYGEEKAAVELAKAVPGYDLLVAAGGFGEPTYQPQSIDGLKTKMILAGNKAMYAGLVGLYENQPMKYARVPLTHEFADAPEMRTVMKDYQEHLQQVGFKELGLEPIPHPSGEKFVGTATCAQCHEDAFDVWSGSAHAEATESIVSPPEDRGDVPRHFDPECISCHVTGWNPQGYYPYASGYETLEGSKHLHGNGCENCHGPGANHATAERDDSGVSDEDKARLRKSMQLPLERAKEHCMKCHDLDNSPAFHEPDAFEGIYWPEVEH
ncbi:MAG: multiheme c-type cytochrome [Pirellulaceae bacterium]